MMNKSIPILLLIALTLPAMAAGAENASTNKKVIVKASEAPLQSSAGSKGKRLDLLTEFTPVEILGEEGSYAKVKTNEGKTGYVLASALATSRFVSTTIKEGQVNVRSTADSDSQTVMMLASNYPLMVLEKKESRVKVVDFEGDGGWVHHTFLSPNRYVVATPPPSASEYVNLREEPGKTPDGKYYRLRFMVEKGTVLEVLGEKDGWIKVKDHEGDEGWCSANIVWGWIDEGVPEKAKSK